MYYARGFSRQFKYLDFFFQIEPNFQATSSLPSLVIAVQQTVVLSAKLNSCVFKIMDINLHYLGITNWSCSRLFSRMLCNMTLFGFVQVSTVELFCFLRFVFIFSIGFFP